jgi:signal transduction histidine kinase/ActR/RegA family two-component response regulator
MSEAIDQNHRRSADASDRATGRRRLSLRQRLILLVLAGVVPLLAFSLGRQYFVYEAELAETGREKLLLARGMRLAIEEALQARIAVLRAIALSRRLREGDLDGFRAQAEAVVAEQFPGATIVLVREDGQHLLSTAQPAGSPLSVRRNLATLRQVFATGQPVVSDLFRESDSAPPTVTIDVPVKDAGGRVTLVLSLKPRLEAFAEIVKRYNPPEDWVISVFDREGVNVSRSLSPERFVGQKAGENLVRRLQTTREGIFEATSREGLELLSTYSRSEVFGWAVSVSVPIADLRQPAIAGALRTMAVGGALMAGGLLLALFLARRISGPIGTLRSLAASSDGDTPVGSPSTGLDETDEVVLALAAAQRRRQQSEAGLRDRTAELETANRSLENEITVRRQAEEKAQAQLARLNLLHQITRAIGERQDLDSIFQVVVRSIEDQLPVDFCCLCLYDRADHALTVSRVGLTSAPLALELAMPERARVDIDENGLSRCVRGQLVYEPDISLVDFPFPRRLAAGGLRALVAAPLQVESQVFGAVIAARFSAGSFSSGECEFLRQLSEHVALASNQAQLHGALQQAYDDLRQTKQAVMQQERLRALGQMASGIAHDINNALSPVALYTESLLEQEPGLSPRTRDYLETIQRAVEDVSHTVARMKDFYRQREPQLTLAPVKLNQLVQQVIDLTRARWHDMAQQRGIVIQMRTDLAVDLPPILGVESEIREALINLIFNAVDAVSTGGTVTLRTHVGANGLVQVEVADTGIGMDEETRRRCLEPFFTTKGERGTGLGLAMVYGMVQRHGGDIEIDSEPGESTTIRLGFPLPSIDESAVAQQQARPMVPRRLRLLVIDDDPLLVKSLRDILEADGHVVTTANDGKGGVAAFLAAEQRGERFAAVITDLGMPYMDGRRVAAAIKDAAHDMPVILLTGWGQRLVSDEEIPPHVDRVLSKPPKIRELRDALGQLCRPAAG